MKLWLSIRTTLSFFFRRRRAERDMEEELRSHLRSRADDLERQGLSRTEAERQAQIEFGGYQRYKEECREALGTRLLGELIVDVRYGLRQLRRNPGFTAVAVITLALGIGANTAIFTVVNAILLEPLPYANPHRLVYIWESWPHEQPVRSVPTPDFANWQAHSRAFGVIAAYGGDRDLDLTSNGEPAPVEGINVSSEFFSALGVSPSLGRTFVGQEEQPNGNPVVLLGHALWRQRFGSDAKILGRSITLDDQEHAVIGVLPSGFRFPDNRYNPQLFFADPNATAANWHSPQYFALQPVIGRLKPGITPAQAYVQLMTLIERARSQEPIQFVHMRAGMEVHIIPLHERLTGSTRAMLLILFGAVGLVLLVACVNVACLELARAMSRQKEIAVRIALGVGRSRLAKQLITEGILLSLFGGATALFMGFCGVRMLRALRPQGIPHIQSVVMDGRVLAFTFAVAIATGVLFGLAPALNSSNVNLLETLKESSPSDAAVSKAWSRLPARGVLVASEIALAGVLLAGAGLLTRTFIHLINVDPGCRTDRVLTLRIALPRSRYSRIVQQTTFFQQLLSRVRALPGVRSAAVGTGIPTACCGYSMGTVVEGKPLPPPGLRPDILFDWTSLGYFRTLGIPFVAGRNFKEMDGQGSPDVAIVNQAFVRQFFPGKNALGKRVNDVGWREIVGIVGDVRQYGPLHQAKPEVYGPLAQDSKDAARMILVIHTMNDPRALIPEVKETVGMIDKSLTVDDVATMEERISRLISGERFNMLLVGILGALALVLVSIGIYGVTSYAVAQRTHEIGIRMALGAQKRDVLRLVMSQGMALALIGVGIGVTGALALTRFLSSMLYGVKPTDPVTFVVVSLVLTGVALLACYIPARRATKVDPMVALRHE